GPPAPPAGALHPRRRRREARGLRERRARARPTRRGRVLRAGGVAGERARPRQRRPRLDPRGRRRELDGEQDRRRGAGHRDRGGPDRLRLQRGPGGRSAPLPPQGLRGGARADPRAALRRAHADRVPEVHGQAARADLHRAQGHLRAGAVGGRHRRVRVGRRGRGSERLLMLPESSGPGHIEIRGAREHNLRGIDVRIPRDRLVVITGLSGSGKSSLAFDTLYAEGQRRYVESLSAYARQFLDQLEKPEVESIEGLSPAISIEQKTVSRNPRSTVGTATEIYDYLRLLYARAGEPHSPRCGEPLART